MRFQNKIAIVTGGASGIGAATVRALSMEGAKVVAVDINSTALQKMDAEMKKIVVMGSCKWVAPYLIHNLLFFILKTGAYLLTLKLSNLF